MTARLSEFATGTGAGVLVDRRNLVHVDVECPKASKRVGIYATEKTARSAVANLKPCRHCRGTT